MHTNFTATDEKPSWRSLLNTDGSIISLTDSDITINCVLCQQTIDQPDYTVTPLPTVTENRLQLEKYLDNSRWTEPNSHRWDENFREHGL